MTSSRENSALQTLPISQLTLGMYVVAIIDDIDIEIKSEGYITQQESIKQLKKANITTVVVDPNKQKKAEQVDRVFADIQTLKKKEEKPTPVRAVTLESEINKANKLYAGAKELQSQILNSVKRNKALKIENIAQTTDALVDSIYRNQDALCCLTRIQGKDTNLLEHSIHVAILMSVFAKHLGFEKRIIQELTLGAFLHDIGKVLIPNDLLNKKQAFTDKEHKIMNSHVALGLKMLEDSPEISHIAMRMVREHHERLDGSGYPQGLKDKEISKYGRMIAIVDSYDDMTCDRPHKSSIYPIAAFKQLAAESPNLFDEELVEKFIQCLGIYPIGTLVKLNSGKLGLISQLNRQRPLHPYVKVFYNIRLNQAIPIEEINLSKCKYKDQIDCCIKPEEFNINLLNFFKMAFVD